MITALLVLGLGGAGAVARFLVDGLVQRRSSGEFPFGTLVVNLGGCLVLGLLTGLNASSQTTLLAGTATVGSYTTFSTWMLETHRPAQAGESPLAWGNVIVSLVAGLACAALGRRLGMAL
ncbi:MAG: fluoride efflux transporter CrcB [Actinomycetota bacterium]|nr:fluoride efflux transporter CrcB [Actinomycetota bacterium]